MGSMGVRIALWGHKGVRITLWGYKGVRDCPVGL